MASQTPTQNRALALSIIQRNPTDVKRAET